MPPSVLSQLIDRLRGPSPTVAVIGLGYVGLPLCMAMAESGARVIGIDVSPDLCDRLNAGHSHVGDIPDARVDRALDRFQATTDYDSLKDADAIVICVPTPLRKSKDPDISYIVTAARAIAQRAHPGQLIVLESTTYPGTTEEVLVPLLRDNDLRPGVDVAVAFSPERVDPGNPTHDIHNTPKVVGGVSEVGTEAARALYERTCQTVVEVSSPATAEMVKLLENIFRSVNIGLVNEFALICHRLGLNVWEVIDAASTKPFGFMRFTPGPGLGGHCIPVDPHYLSWKLRSKNFAARFVELADAINSRMPEHVLSIVSDALNDRERSVRGSRVLVLGVAYKPDVADVRESPAFDVIELLLDKGAQVDFHDPYVQKVRVGDRDMSGVEFSEQIIQDADCVVIITHHSWYDMDLVLRSARLIVDTRNVTAPALGRAPEHAHKVRLI